MLDLTGTPETILCNAEKIASQMDFGHQRLILLLNKEDVVAGTKQNGSDTELEKFSDEKEENSQNGDEIEPDNKKNALNKNVININNIVSFIDNKLVNPNINVLPISAKKGTGLDRLKTLLVSYRKDMLTDSDTSTVTNARHYEALSKTSEALERVKSGLASGIPTDLVAQDLREALYHLGTIVGEVTTDEVLGNIFSHFCIGK
jgi:tRNA U34 5-carboxymethylaminomethyl modifying GTPase MnmE/TrmE